MTRRQAFSFSKLNRCQSTFLLLLGAPVGLHFSISTSLPPSHGYSYAHHSPRLDECGFRSEPLRETRLVATNVDESANRGGCAPSICARARRLRRRDPMWCAHRGYACLCVGVHRVRGAIVGREVLPARAHCERELRAPGPGGGGASFPASRWRWREQNRVRGGGQRRD